MIPDATILTVWGAPGEGKTLFAFRLAREAILGGRRVYTNIRTQPAFFDMLREKEIPAATLWVPMKFSHFKYDTFAEWLMRDPMPLDLSSGCARDSVVIIDESYQIFADWSGSQEPLGRAARQLRRRGILVILICQEPNDVPHCLRGLANFNFQCVNLMARGMAWLPLPGWCIAKMRPRQSESGRALATWPNPMDQKTVAQYNSYGYVEMAGESRIAKPKINRGQLVNYATWFLSVILLAYAWSVGGKAATAGKRADDALTKIAKLEKSNLGTGSWRAPLTQGNAQLLNVPLPAPTITPTLMGVATLAPAAATTTTVARVPETAPGKLAAAAAPIVISTPPLPRDPKSDTIIQTQGKWLTLRDRNGQAYTIQRDWEPESLRALYDFNSRILWGARGFSSTNQPTNGDQ